MSSTANSLVDGFDAIIRYLGGYIPLIIHPLPKNKNKNIWQIKQVNHEAISVEGNTY